MHKKIPPTKNDRGCLGKINLFLFSKIVLLFYYLLIIQYLT
nr:MAG TPA: hypothetical protein [Caudoviricetes sp.]